RPGRGIFLCGRPAWSKQNQYKKDTHPANGTGSLHAVPGIVPAPDGESSAMSLQLREQLRENSAVGFRQVMTEQARNCGRHIDVVDDPNAGAGSDAATPCDERGIHLWIGRDE